MMILDLYRQGLSVSAIARQLGVDRKTVRKYIACGLEPPAYGPRQPRPRRLDAFTTYLRERTTAYRGSPARGWGARSRSSATPAPIQCPGKPMTDLSVIGLVARKRRMAWRFNG